MRSCKVVDRKEQALIDAMLNIIINSNNYSRIPFCINPCAVELVVVLMCKTNQLVTKAMYCNNPVPNSLAKQWDISYGFPYSPRVNTNTDTHINP